jgi:cullin 1
MWEEFQKLLDYDKDEDLQRMYALLARIPEGLEPLRKKFEEHVKQAGLAAVSKLVGDGASAVDTLVSRTVCPVFYAMLMSIQDPKAYVDALLEVHKKNQETVNRSFKGEAGFVASLDKVSFTVCHYISTTNESF